MKMKKLLKISLCIIIICIIFLTGITFYVGNYLYDYTLNPASHHTLFENMSTQKTSDSTQWLDTHSVNVSIQSHDDLFLHASYIEQDTSVYVIMVHGYRGTGASIISPIKRFYKQGYNLLIPDLRGHGQSEGDYIGMGWDDRYDIMGWIDYIIAKDKKAQIILYGVSMGGATVMDVAGEVLPQQVKAVIEDCGYTSVWDVFQYHIPMEKWQSEIALHMASVVTRIRAGYALEDVSPLKQVQKSHVPILFIHGSEDDFVPCEMVNTLYQSATCPKEKLIIEGAGHAQSCSTDPKTYYSTIFQFIERYTKK